MKKEGLSRRDFLKGSAAGAAGLAAAGILGACSSKAAASDSEAASQAESSAAAEGMADEVAYQTAESQTKWAFEIPPEPIPEDEIKETLEAEVIVVGAGTAGLCTAVSAVESGLDVILISASEAPVSRGGSNHAFASRLLKEKNVEHEPVNQTLRKELLANSGNVDERKWYKLVRDSEEAMNWMLDLMDQEGVKYGLEGIPHLYDEKDPMYMSPGSHCFTDEDGTYPAGLGQQVAVEALARHFESLGGTIYYKNIGKQLIREDNNKGRVSAIVALREDGSYAKYSGSKAIVLATGDFSADKDMVAKYCPSILPLIKDVEEDYNRGLACNGIFFGDGQKMGLWVGAAWQRAFPNAPMIIGGAFCAQPSLSHTGLLLNKEGKRFSNEQSIFALSAYKNLQQTDGTVYGIWGTNYAEDGGPWYRPNSWYEDEPFTTEEVIESWDDAAKAGIMSSGGDSMSTCVKADTIEEVIKLLGLPEDTINEVKHYNELCEAREDTDFFKDPKLMVPIKEGPFYGCGGAKATCLTICGGLRTNDKMQVCEEDDTPIEGLYNVGIMVGDMYSSIYSFMVQGMNYGSCVTFGYRLGRDLAEA